MTSNSRIQILRRKAAQRQGGQCYYCHFPMWESDPGVFSARFALSRRAALHFRCTAEHLKARCDGGRDIAENIVAACQFCNGNRHRKKLPKDAASYANFVRSRLQQGRWHPVKLKHQTSQKPPESPGAR
ncbi:restriction endonuclease [Rhizobium sullae]|uniref:Restriction endonuclease n=1 Tax=Rhizobium sullae TaxID=50338 RepID=A0A2N0DAU8_RHISU|nr:restriction endonuclease [Rhizobium sullae]